MAAKDKEANTKPGVAPLTSFPISDLDPVDYLASGIYPLDLLLGNAQGDKTLPMGIGRGKMIEFFGPNKSAKSEVAQIFIRAALHHPMFKVKYFDQEWSADVRKMGVSLEVWEERGDLYRADNLEQFYAQCLWDLKALLKLQKEQKNRGTKQAPGLLIVLDSMAALKCKANANKEVGDVVIGGEARLNSEELPRLRKYIGLTGSILIWVNQTRGKMGGTMPGATNETTPGGEATRFYADYRVRMAFAGNMWMRSGKTAPAGSKVRPDGFLTVVKFIKNKMAPPMGELEMVCWYKPPAPGYMSGLSEPWTIFTALHTGKKIKSAGGKYKLSGLDEAFSRPDWMEIFSARKIEVLAAFDKMMLSTPGGKDEADDDDDDD